MEKFLTDVHIHSTFSFDGRDTLKDILFEAHAKGYAFLGVAEHFDYDWLLLKTLPQKLIDAENYFHEARRLQEDYQGCMNVLIGAEFGYADDERVAKKYAETVEKYRPDFIVNSVHTLRGEDYYFRQPFYTQKGEGKLREKREVYEEYLSLLLKSVHASYPYDIVGHIGYATRYAPYEDKSLSYAEFKKPLDEILQAIIDKNKILEVNTAVKDERLFVPTDEIVKRYYQLGGRNVSFASDAHIVARIGDKRAETVKRLKEIGFTHITVPFRGEYIKVEI